MPKDISKCCRNCTEYYYKYCAYYEENNTHHNLVKGSNGVAKADQMTSTGDETLLTINSVDFVLINKTIIWKFYFSADWVRYSMTCTVGSILRRTWINQNSQLDHIFTGPDNFGASTISLVKEAWNIGVCRYNYATNTYYSTVFDNLKNKLDEGNQVGNPYISFTDCPIVLTCQFNKNLTVEKIRLYDYILSDEEVQSEIDSINE